MRLGKTLFGFALATVVALACGGSGDSNLSWLLRPEGESSDAGAGGLCSTPTGLYRTPPASDYRTVTHGGAVFYACACGTGCACGFACGELTVPLVGLNPKLQNVCRPASEVDGGPDGMDGGSDDATTDAPKDAPMDSAKCDLGEDFSTKVADASLDETGTRSTGLCFACLKQPTTCQAEVTACNAECDCKAPMGEVISCVGKGGNTFQCGAALIAAPAKAREAGLRLLQCAQAKCPDQCSGPN